jgi:poly(A) polymerase
VIGHRFAPVLRELQPLSDRFAAAGHRLFLVGGTVRDLLLAEQGDDRVSDHGDHRIADHMITIDHDFDIDATTTARPPEIKQCLLGWADAVWTQGERFGTIAAMKRVPSTSPSAAPNDIVERVYEITTHRAEAYQGDSRKPTVEFSYDIHADLSRRDFTVNAMAIELTPTPAGAGTGIGIGTAAGMDIDALTVIDPFGGQADLIDRVLRTPLGPEASFSDDPLRMLRAARFIARYRLQPDASLLRAVRAMGDRMQIVSAERIRDELGKLLGAPLPGDGLQFVARTGLLQHVVPELVAAESQRDETCHEHLWAHTVALVDAVCPPDQQRAFERRLVRLAALLRPLGPAKARARLLSLRHANDQTHDVGQLIELLAPLLARLVHQDDPWSDGDIRRHVRAAGTLLPALHEMVRAEASVHTGTVAFRLTEGLRSLQARIGAMAQTEPLDDLGPQIDGAQVMAALRVGPGPAVGRALAFLTEVRLDEGLLASSELQIRLEEWWSNHKEK